MAQAQGTLSKVQKTFDQITLLYDRCSVMKQQLEAITSGGRMEHYYSVWNKLQVYEGVRCVFSAHLVKLAELSDSHLSDVISSHHSLLASHPHLFC